MAVTVEECSTRIAELEASLKAYLDAPEKHNTGKSGYDAGTKKIQNLRQELDRWKRKMSTAANGGIPIRTQRGCGSVGVGLDSGCGCDD